jgi:hypothetical protein
MIGAEGSALRDLLVRRIGGAEREAVDEIGFEGLALRVLRYQARANPVYGALLAGRGLDPLELEDWRSFPPVPARAFKDHPPLAADPADVRQVFRTSGTTAGPGRRGEHPVVDPELYRASVLSNARAHLLPDREAIRVVALLPPPSLLADSSLAHMAGILAEAWDPERPAFFADAEWRVDGEGLRDALLEAEGAGEPVLLLATAFGLVHWLERDPRPVNLPPGSRVMETGGFKGRSRQVERSELYGALSSALGVPPERIVNEYGMTELLSQFYEPVLLEGGPADPAARRHVEPWWVRTRVLDPVDLRASPPGEPGVLCHLDLANLFSAALVLTEDRGVRVEGGFRPLGRISGSEPRGCSLSVEAYLEAAR